jgi:cobalt-zinc-cadmium efflux system outer membrane protein
MVSHISPAAAHFEARSGDAPAEKLATSRATRLQSSRIPVIKISARTAAVFMMLVIALAAIVGCDTSWAANAALQQLTLEQARALMRENNRELRLARHAVAGAEADILSAAAPPNPTLSISSAKLGPGHGSDSPSLWNRVESSVGVTQLFERGRKRELRTEAARLTASATRSEAAAVERQQRIELARTYYDLAVAQERVRIASENAALFDNTIEAAERRVQAGDLSRADLARLTVDALRARNEAEQGRLERERAQVALGYVIGAEADARSIEAADPWPPIAPLLDRSTLGRYVDQRPDVQAAEARVQAADTARALAQSLRTRDVTAGLQYDRTPADVTRHSVGVSVSVPLFTRYYYEGEIRRSEADFLTAQTTLERTRAAALSEINAAAATYNNTAERVVRFQSVLLKAAEQAAAGAEFAYSRGAIGVMDLLDARRQLHATRLEYADALGEYAKALSIWRASTETGGNM